MGIPLQGWGLPKKNFDKIWQQLSKPLPTRTTARATVRSQQPRHQTQRSIGQRSHLPIVAHPLRPDKALYHSQLFPPSVHPCHYTTPSCFPSTHHLCFSLSNLICFEELASLIVLKGRLRRRRVHSTITYQLNKE